ncbi:hypothetical protein PV08_00172 [Exophiala spinifera]|uniref:Uncharacterized protein n=1 Tax=Exophiala spinifera TaxID=91928 RepID=A0A0D2C7R2_9EURO|nr:uncharacterized protein PV08_00172 [Exophiala spinifera]KIW19599.1 hypothetical protein PV08_00172 [Exophiala spinifera]
MADNKSDSGNFSTAPGGRQHQADTDSDDGYDDGTVNNVAKQLPAPGLQPMQPGLLDNRTNPRAVRGLTKEEVKEVSGSLKIHVKLNLEVDLRVQASLNGDIVIGIL